MYWKEQVHLLSAQRLAPTASSNLRIALIYGRADFKHPALRGLSPTQVDVAQSQRTGDVPDPETTALAGLLAARGEANSYQGVAPGSSLLVLNVLSKGSVYASDMVGALHAATIEGARVVCLPVGGPERPADLQKAIRAAVRAGLTIVCPAGFEGSRKHIYPAAFPECISVGTVDERNMRAPWSGVGNWVHVAAPGAHIPVPALKGKYEPWFGTSLSCAIVAGVVALMLRANPGLTPTDIKKILIASAIGAPAGVGSPLERRGYGLVNAHQAVQRAIAKRNAARKRSRATRRRS